jgi:colanic acid biosynthesis glycosyl transferase WcaI
MKITVFSQYYYPEGVPKTYEIAEALARRGHEVSVVTGFPHYPGGKLLGDYRLSLYRREAIHGIPVLRTFEYPYHGEKPLLRILNYVSFMLSSPFAAFFAPHTDVIYVWHPPLTVGIAAWIFSKLTRTPYVYDVQDIWPDFVVLSGMMKEGMAVRFLRRIEKFVYRKSNHIIVGTETARKNLLEKNVQSSKISVLPNWVNQNIFVDTKDFPRESLRSKLNWTGKFVFLFAGNLGIVQGLDTIISAAELLKDEENIRITFVGDGIEKSRLEKIVREKHLTNVEFLDRRPMEEMPGLMAASDVLLVHLLDSGLSQYVIPSKVMAYLSSRKPILVAINGIAADLIATANAGFVVEAENSRALATEMLRVSKLNENDLAEFGNNGKKYLDENFSEEFVVSQYEELLSRIAMVE